MDAYIGEIRAVGFNYAPEGWALCNGQILSVQANQALFTVIGDAFGGDGENTFGLPNLNGTVITQQGQGPTLQPRAWGEAYGEEAVQLMTSQLPPHSHTLQAAVCDPVAELPAPAANTYLGRSTVAGTRGFVPDASTVTPFASQAIGPAGGGQAHENRQPFVVMNYIICVSGGYYPVRDN